MIHHETPQWRLWQHVSRQLGCEEFILCQRWQRRQTQVTEGRIAPTFKSCNSDVTVDTNIAEGMSLEQNKKKNSCTYPAHVRRADIRCSDPNPKLSGPLQIVSLRYSSLWLVSPRSARLTLANSLHMMTRGKIALNSSFKLAQLGAESGFRRWNHLVVFRSPEGKNVSVRPVDVRRHFPASPLPSTTHWRCQQNSVSNITV